MSSKQSGLFHNLVKQCDGFPKVDVSYLNPTTSGGLTSIVAFTLIILLSLTEIWRYFTAPHVSYALQVDRELQSEIQLHFDISLACPCDQMVVAVMDAGGQKDVISHLVSQEPIYWRPTSRDRRVEGCRVRGNVPLNKVTGELIFLPNAGMLPGPYGRVLLFFDSRVNFSHRIHRFAFGPGGESVLGREFKEKYFRNPLDGAHQLNMERDRSFTYKLSVFPTKFFSGSKTLKLSTNQYSVVGVKSRQDDPNVVLPGLFVAYDLEPLSVSIRSEYRHFLWFFVSVLGIVGGIYTCSGLIHHCVHHFYIYYLAGRNAFRGRYLGVLDSNLPDGSISCSNISTADELIPLIHKG